MTASITNAATDISNMRIVDMESMAAKKSLHTECHNEKINEFLMNELGKDSIDDVCFGVPMFNSGKLVIPFKVNSNNSYKRYLLESEPAKPWLARRSALVACMLYRSGSYNPVRLVEQHVYAD